ncbi:MAG: pilus assembly protein [Bryobacteraceae bacterium]|nr:pilus assembly protein [Bryobacteraceae bacterium]
MFTQRIVNRASRRNRRRSGHAALEIGLVMLPTFAVIFGFLDIGMALFSWSTLQNAVREGCRYAITYQMDGNSNHDTAIRKKVSQFSMGLVKWDASPNLIFIDYYAPANPNTVLAFPNGNNPGNIIEVSVRNYPWRWIAPFSGTISQPSYAVNPLNISVYSADIMGGYPLGVTSVPR